MSDNYVKATATDLTVVMSKITSLFRDDDYSGNERKYYSWLKTYYFREPEYLVYPNVALQVIINSDSPSVEAELDTEPKWKSTRNFFDNSSVDLCVIRKSDYLPFVALEIDGKSHDKPEQAKSDKLKDLLFEKAGIPLRRLRVNRGKTETEERDQLAQAISSLNREICSLSVGVPNTVQGKRSILSGIDIKEYYDLLNRMFCGDECVVLPNVALQSIFADKHGKGFKYGERNLCQIGLVDFCIVETDDFRPIVAFTVTKDKSKSKVFHTFGLPLLHLGRYGDIMNHRGPTTPL